MMRGNRWARLLAYITGLVNQRLLLQCEYLVAENRILRSHVTVRLRLSDPERSTLAEIAKRIGPEASGGACLSCQTRYDLGLVSAADRLQRSETSTWESQSERIN
jgi:hypothetical protein